MLFTVEENRKCTRIYDYKTGDVICKENGEIIGKVYYHEMEDIMKITSKSIYSMTNERFMEVLREAEKKLNIILGEVDDYWIFIDEIIMPYIDATGKERNYVKNKKGVYGTIVMYLVWKNYSKQEIYDMMKKNGMQMHPYIYLMAKSWIKYRIRIKYKEAQQLYMQGIRDL